MASYTPGYDEERFVTTINRNFLCLICFNVLKDPVLCPRNQHSFCRGCITRHLENSRRCPMCADELTEETLTEPQRMVKDYLNELNIRCVFNERGCQEIVQLQHLDQHEDSCGFTPAVCTNPGCGATLNKRDLIHHESELCEYRKLKCHSCEEMTKTLADVEKRITNVEKNLDAMEKHSSDTNEQLKGITDEIRVFKAAMCEGLDQMHETLLKTRNKARKHAGNAARCDRENIIVAGGATENSVEMFNWLRRRWTPLQSMPENRHAASSFVYNHQMTVAGGWCDGAGRVLSMIRMNVEQKPDLSRHWSDCLVKLPAKLAFHSSVLSDDKLMVTGGESGSTTSDCIYEVQIVPSYTVKTLSRMPEPRQRHCTEIFDDSLLIFGGRTTGLYTDSLNSVVLYDVENNACKQLAPLPHEVSDMATVRWGDNVVVLGGIDKRGNKLNAVIMYNVNTEQRHVLPPMRCRRCGCAAVVVENNIVVLGGRDEQGQALRSVEGFSFERYTWQELPEMSQARAWHTAVVG